jgi:hypothetical protein
MYLCQVRAQIIYNVADVIAELLCVASLHRYTKKLSASKELLRVAART